MSEAPLASPQNGYDDPRLVGLYDQDNPDGPDHDLYRALADEIDAESILDLGCGTGILTVTFAAAGRVVVGVDPSAAMLEVARQRPGGENVRWLHGDSTTLAAAGGQPGGSDYAVMTGNVAQHILDPHWQTALTHLADTLRPGGVLAFEARNPAVRAWESWAAEPPEFRETGHGRLREWQEVSEPEPGVVRMLSHHVFEASEEHLVTELVLAFRDRAVIEEQLREAGFVVEEVWGDWVRTPMAADSPLMVFRARRT